MTSEMKLPAPTLVGGRGQPLSGEQYRVIMDTLAQTLRPLQVAPLDELFVYLGKAETLGPLLDPTAYHWRGGRENLADQRDLLEAARVVQKALNRIRDRRAGASS